MITTYLLLQGALFLLFLGGFFQVTSFLRSHDSISNAPALFAFKRMARVNMYAALVYIVLSIPVFLLSVFIGYQYGLLGVAVVLGTCVPQFGAGKLLRTYEERSRSLRCLDQYAEEHRRVSTVWLKKPLPDF